jgi:hypothetical protein
MKSEKISSKSVLIDTEIYGKTIFKAFFKVIHIMIFSNFISFLCKNFSTVSVSIIFIQLKKVTPAILSN